MKYITFTIPSYNSQEYMRHVIDNLVAVGDDIEVIIVNDGSKDDTGKIADEYQNKYPTIVKAIQKENGGHGSGVMAGIHNATGIYYKVVDSDDWVETADVINMLDLIKKHMAEGLDIDLYITNYVYEHAADNSQFVMHYRKCLPAEKAFTWKEMKHVKLETVFLMHSLMYKLDKLKASGMELPNHTFYVDDIYAYVPLPHMGKVFYHDLDFYHYKHDGVYVEETHFGSVFLFIVNTLNVLSGSLISCDGVFPVEIAFSVFVTEVKAHKHRYYHKYEQYRVDHYDNYERCDCGDDVTEINAEFNREVNR